MESIKEILNNNNIIIEKKEHLLSLFIRFFKNIIIFVSLSIVLSYILYVIYESKIIIFLIILFALVLIFMYLRVFYNGTFIVVTSTKIIKSVRNGLFSSHIIELPLERVRQIRADNHGVLGRIFGFGNIEIQAFEESSNMYFKSMSKNKLVMKKISTILEKLRDN